jgi:UDP-N-acetylglucosamine 2-epimerase (non-hydrolysing)
MTKILVLAGTRPEAVKMAPVLLALRKRVGVNALLCSSGQHRQMLDQALGIFGLTPDIDLDVMQPNQTLAASAALILSGLDAVFAREQPDWVLVQGDTTTVMAATLAAFFHKIKIGHVEAGLRTYDKYSPFPEEGNRRIADALADLYFAPSMQTRANLLAERVDPARVIVTGNTVIDALLLVRERVRGRSLAHLTGEIGDKQLVLITSHRRESFGAPFENTCRALRTLAERYRDRAHFVYPVHLNPNIQAPAHALLGGIANLTLTEPVDYATIVALMDRAHFILTDSGGLQEEAPSLGKPVLVLREKTERVEVVDCGAAKLVGTDYDVIVRESIRLFEDPVAYRAMANAGNPYGDGRAAERIADAVLAHAADTGAR